MRELRAGRRIAKFSKTFEKHMNKLMRFLRVDFLPRNVDLALLTLRLWIGLSMLLLHGWGKFINFDTVSQKFMNLFGIGSKASLALAIFGEVGCSILLVLGLFTRFAAFGGIILMTVAFLLAHKAVLKGPGSGELAFIYLATYVALFLAGGGKFSIDARMGGNK
jgi:putative oxidoreductase